MVEYIRSPNILSIRCDSNIRPFEHSAVKYSLAPNILIFDGPNIFGYSVNTNSNIRLTEYPNILSTEYIRIFDKISNIFEYFRILGVPKLKLPGVPKKVIINVCFSSAAFWMKFEYVLKMCCKIFTENLKSLAQIMFILSQNLYS